MRRTNDECPPHPLGGSTCANYYRAMFTAIHDRVDSQDTITVDTHVPSNCGFDDPRGYMCVHGRVYWVQIVKADA